MSRITIGGRWIGCSVARSVMAHQNNPTEQPHTVMGKAQKVTTGHVTDARGHPARAARTAPRRIQRSVRADRAAPATRHLTAQNVKRRTGITNQRLLGTANSNKMTDIRFILSGLFFCITLNVFRLVCNVNKEK